VSVETANLGVWVCAKVPRLGGDVAVSKDGEDSQNGGEVGGHVEALGSGGQDLLVVD